MDPLFRVPTVTEWDQWRSQDLCYDQVKVFPQSFGRDVLAGIATHVKHLDVRSLAGYIYRRGLIGDTQYGRLTEPRSTAEDRTLELSRILMLVQRARDPPQDIKRLYLALCDSYEDDVGQESHYQFAQILRNKGLALLVCPVETYEKRMKEVSTVVANVPSSVTISEDQCRQLRHSLGLSFFAEEGNLRRILDEWYNNYFGRPSLAELVKALMVTPGLGRHVSRLVPYCLSNCPGVCVHIRNLGDNWKSLAKYMGYARAEVEGMERSSAGAKQFQTFLRVWRMPHCNGSEVAILEEVMRRAAQQQLVGGKNAGDAVAVNDLNKQNRPQRSVNVHYNIQYNTLVPSLSGGITQPFTNATTPAVMGYPLESTLRQLSLQNSPPVYTGVLPPPLNIPGFDRQDYKDGTVPASTTQPLTQPGQTQMPPQSRSTQPAGSGATMSSQLTQPRGHPPAPTMTYNQPSKQSRNAKPTGIQSRVHGSGLMEDIPASKQAMQPSDGTALLEACKVDDWPTAMALVNSGSSLESRSTLDGRTPLMIVCLKQNADLAIKLVKNRADVLALDVNGQCCLHYPETLRNAKLAEYLIKVYTTYDYSLDTPDTERSYTPLMVACTLGDGVRQVAESLLKSGANPNGDPGAHTRPLIESCAGGHTRLVELLLEYGADADIVDKTGSTPLLEAAYKNRWNIVDFLVEHGAHVNKAEDEGTTVLFIAVGANALPMVKTLIANGARVNARRMPYGVTENAVGQAGEMEETPLARACAQGFQSIAELLIDNGADSNYLCSGVLPPLGYAIIQGQMHIVKFLLSCPQLDKSLHGLQVPIIQSVKMEKWDYTRVLLQELGGQDKALQRALQNKLPELAEYIQLFMAMNSGPEVPSTPRLEPEVHWSQSSSDAELQRQQTKSDKILCQFSQICVRSIVDRPNVNLKEVISAMKALGYPHVANLLTRCFNGTQDNEALRTDFLGDRPSAAECLIENGLLSSEDFQAEALKYFPYEPGKFYQDLVWVFHQTPGGESLPFDVQAVLTRFFTGQFQFNIRSTGKGQEPTRVGAEVHSPQQIPVQRTLQSAAGTGLHAEKTKHKLQTNGSVVAGKRQRQQEPPRDRSPVGAESQSQPFPVRSAARPEVIGHHAEKIEPKLQMNDSVVSVPGKPLEMVKAVHTFSTTDPGRLSLEAGDILLVLQKDVQAKDGWWLVKRESDNRQGLVPFAFLQPLSPSSKPDPADTSFHGMKVEADSFRRSADGVSVIEACQRGEWDNALQLIDSGHSVEDKAQDGTTPLFEAVEKNQENYVEILLGKNADPNVIRMIHNPGRDTVEETPLAHACARGFLGIVELLVSKGAKLNYRCSGSFPPLGFAALTDQYKIVEYLFSQPGLDKSIDAVSVPIMVAIKGKNTRCVTLLLEKLGGHETVLRKARQEQVHNLVEQIEEYVKMSASGKYPTAVSKDEGEVSVEEVRDSLREVQHLASSSPKERSHSLPVQVFRTVFEQLAPDMKFLEVERTGRNIGRGAFGRVVELKCKGVERPLAGKILRDDDLGTDREQAQESVKIFFREYKILTTLPTHQNIVPYRGLCFVEYSEFPVLVMELMSTDLHAFLLSKKNAGLQLDTKITILHEISRGLAYLHSNRIVHRDLSARNVLMDASGTPKISDFGNSNLIDSVSATSNLGVMTGRVGTLLYMAPEVNAEEARYNTKVDVFSFGHLALFVSIQKFPRFLKPAVYTIGDRMECRSEVERREEYFKELPTSFPLTNLVKMCLHNSIDHRPSSHEVKRQLKLLKDNTSIQ